MPKYCLFKFFFFFLWRVGLCFDGANVIFSLLFHTETSLLRLNKAFRFFNFVQSLQRRTGGRLLFPLIARSSAPPLLLTRPISSLLDFQHGAFEGKTFARAKKTPALKASLLLVEDSRCFGELIFVLCGRIA